MAQKHSGFPRNLGDPAVSTGLFGFCGMAEPKDPWPCAVVSCAAGAKPKTLRVVPPSEGNEVRREGRQEVVAP
jgi:hypothetical protein